MDETEDEFTEIVDATVPRVDLVSKGANGLPFLIAKSADGGLVPADEIRALIGDSPIEKTTAAETVTVTGSPASIAHMIHQAAIRDQIRKADPTAPGQPTHTEEAAVAKETEDLTKADTAPVEVADIVPDAPAGGTAESVPGSPDWEQLDADTAASAIGVLGRVKAALEWLATREATEAVTEGDTGDADNAFDLQDAVCQIECIIRRLGGFAAGEQLEADLPDEVEAVTKAVADAASLLGDLEPLAAIEKAGRVLSSQNEQRVRNASGLLQEVLATLPAPVEAEVVKSDESEEVADVAKTAGTITINVSPALDPAAVARITEQLNTIAKAAEGDADALAVLKNAADGAQAENVDLAEVTQAIEKATDAGQAAQVASEQLTEKVDELTKAKGDPQLIVYDENGKVVGIVDPSKVQPIADSSTSTDETPAEPTPADSPAEAPAAPAAPAAAPAAATVPGTDTVAAPAPTNDNDDAVQKAASHAELATLLKEVLDPVTEKLGQYAELGDVVKGLQEQVEHLAAMPDDRKSPIMKGATGVPGIATRDGSDATDPLEELRKAAADETKSAEDRLAARNQLAYAAIRERLRPTHG